MAWLTMRVLFTVLLALPLIACTTSEPDIPPGPMCGEAGAADPLTASLTTPIVSLGKDVGPILQMSCSIAGSTCHGDPSVTQMGRPYFGLPDGGIDAKTIHDAVVNVASAEDPKLVMVSPGSLDKSFLWQKVDNQQCNFAADCNATNNIQYINCGLSMPYSNNALEIEQLNTIARWIVQGAQNN
jgi:hypothetical protein